MWCVAATSSCTWLQPGRWHVPAERGELGSYPENLHKLNQGGSGHRACTQLELTIEEIDEAAHKCRDSWTIQINADKQLLGRDGRMEPAHYGYTISILHAGRFTAHLYMQTDPDNPRGPFDKPDLGQCVCYCKGRINQGAPTAEAPSGLSLRARCETGSWMTISSWS